MRKAIVWKKSMEQMLWLFGAAVFLGTVLQLLGVWRPVSDWAPLLASQVWRLMRSAGITVIVLIPLTVWALKTWFSTLSADHKKVEYQYVGAQAKEVGFVGTLIGIMIMFGALSISLSQGDSGSIRQAIGGFSQAVISSLIGYVISVVCKHLYYLEQRKEAIRG